MVTPEQLQGGERHQHRQRHDETDGERARQSPRKSRITSSERMPAEHDLLAQIGQRIVHEAGLRGHHQDGQVGELRPSSRTDCSERCVTATVFAPASL